MNESPEEIARHSAAADLRKRIAMMEFEMTRPTPAQLADRALMKRCHANARKRIRLYRAAIRLCTR